MVNVDDDDVVVLDGFNGFVAFIILGFDLIIIIVVVIVVAIIATSSNLIR